MKLVGQSKLIFSLGARTLATGARRTRASFGAREHSQPDQVRERRALMKPRLMSGLGLETSPIGELGAQLEKFWRNRSQLRSDYISMEPSRQTKQLQNELNQTEPALEWRPPTTGRNQVGGAHLNGPLRVPSDTKSARSRLARPIRRR